MVTGENAMCPTTRPSASATSETVSAPAARSASTMNCSVWLLIASVSNASTVTTVITPASAARSSRITIVPSAIAFPLSMQAQADPPLSYYRFKRQKDKPVAPHG